VVKISIMIYKLTLWRSYFELVEIIVYCVKVLSASFDELRWYRAKASL